MGSWNHKLAKEGTDDHRYEIGNILTVHSAFYPGSNTDRLYSSRRKRGRGLNSCQNCVELEADNSLRWFVKYGVEPLLMHVKKSSDCDKNEKIKVKENGMNKKKMFSGIAIVTNAEADAEGR